MRVARSHFSFIAVLAVGLFLMAGSLLLPAPTTEGAETDVPATSSDLLDLTNPSPAQPSAHAAPSASQPLPPRAPVESPTGGVGQEATRLPSAGKGGSASVVAGYLLMGLGAALLGTGSCVWVYSRRTR